jgi:gamma-glutamyltranspeptidase / glutathione hydrolase / leukotriene-C4 hydrolase
VQSHTSVVDVNGMAVVVSSTVNLVFGSQVLDPVTGILFNNEVREINHHFKNSENDICPRWMTFPHQESRMPSASGLHRVCCDLLYSLGPDIHRKADNYPEAHKRPLSSTAPTIIENPDGSFYLALGASGGSKIFPAVFQVILNLDWGLDISSAIEYPRLHHQLYPEFVKADDSYPHELLAELERRGHSIFSA